MRRKGNRQKNKKILYYGIALLWILLCMLITVIIKKFVLPGGQTDKEQGAGMKTESAVVQRMVDTAVRTVKAQIGNDDVSGGEGQEGDTQEEGGRPEYPAPEYPFRTEEVTIKIPDLSREYTLAWVSDVHMITDHEPTEDVPEEFMETLEQRYELLFVTEDEEPVHSADLWPEIVKFLNYGQFDGIIFGGDMMDYYSSSNMDAFLSEYEKLDSSVPLLYIRADHDYGAWYGEEVRSQEEVYELHRMIDGDDLQKKYLDFGEFMIIGINASTVQMSLEQYEIIRRLYDEGKPVIIATHVPYASWIDGTLEELSMEVRGVKYYWGDGSYIADEVTWKYLTEMIYSQDTSVCGVLAGHLHAEWDGPLTEQVSQHIFSPAFQGVIGIIHVVPEG